MVAAIGDLRPMYKKLLKLAKTLPADKRAATLEQIRREFRTHNDINDPKECVLSLSYTMAMMLDAKSFAGVSLPRTCVIHVWLTCVAFAFV